MRGHSVTIKDLAKELSISPSTVSRALKDHPDISVNTKKLVKETANRLRYQPNVIALSLKHKKTFTIGIIVPEIIHFFFSTVISGIEDVAYKAGYNVMICQSNETYSREITDTRALFNSQVDGLLGSISRQTRKFDHFKEFLDNGVPVVLFDRTSDELNVDSVIIDDYKSAYKAVNHLVDQGYNKIAHIAGPKNLKITEERLRGYQKAVADAKLSMKDEWVVFCDKGDIEIGERIAMKMLKSGDPPDAIFTSNDMNAYGVLTAAKKSGIKVPRQLGVVGFSNWQFSGLINPTLTTVAQPGFRMGQEAVRLLLKRLENNEEYTAKYDPVTKVLSTELIIRESSLKKS